MFYKTTHATWSDSRALTEWREGEGAHPTVLDGDGAFRNAIRVAREVLQHFERTLAGQHLLHRVFLRTHELYAETSTLIRTHLICKSR